MMRWLVLRFNAPLASFGGTAIDSRGVTRDFPAASAITGLLANALGYARYETGRLDRLQARLVFGVRRESEHPLGRMTDYQTAQVYENDKGWTCRGTQGREKSPSYKNSDERGKWLTHERWRDYHADTDMTVVISLLPADEVPDLDTIAAALDRPARPLFIGRKSCLPAGYLLGGENERWIDADGAHAALIAVAGGSDEMSALWPAAPGEGHEIADHRNWRSGLHGGTRRVMERRMTPVDRS
jgi:CRISPR system Cascade subunit CasD